MDMNTEEREDEQPDMLPELPSEDLMLVWAHQSGFFIND